MDGVCSESQSRIVVCGKTELEMCNACADLREVVDWHVTASLKAMKGPLLKIVRKSLYLTMTLSSESMILSREAVEKNRFRSGFEPKLDVWWNASGLCVHL